MRYLFPFVYHAARALPQLVSVEFIDTRIEYTYPVYRYRLSFWVILSENKNYWVRDYIQFNTIQYNTIQNFIGN